jgi:hypothetical protein
LEVEQKKRKIISEKKLVLLAGLVPRKQNAPHPPSAFFLAEKTLQLLPTELLEVPVWDEQIAYCHLLAVRKIKYKEWS